MKKLLISLLLIITANLSYSQQWKVDKRNDAFSGKVSTAYTIGYNGRSPYKNPIIAFKRFQDGTVEGVITSAGSLICSEYYPSITFAFNGKFEDELRITLTPSNDNEIGYFDEAYSDKRKILKLIEKLKSSNYAEVLFETSCSTNRFKIGLSGSTKALNEVVGDYYLKKRDSYLASEKIKSDSINALNDAVLPKYLEWKSHIDNDISRIYENYLVRDKYDKNEIYSFEDFKKICYKEIEGSYVPFADESLSVKFPLISYYKNYTVGNLKKYTNSMVINLSVKTERNRRSKIVGSKIERYIEIENELISTKKDGSEDDIFAFRQNWILEKKN